MVGKHAKAEDIRRFPPVADLDKPQEDAEFDPLIPLVEVIAAAKNVSSMMPREHRCTSLGGLATTPASLEIERKLGALKNKGCGTCECP